jgi:eukaryotic-like serine/threonine-protein kinase
MTQRAPNRPEAPFVDELFDELAGLDAAQRDLVLRDRCASYPSVEEQVRVLLAALDADPGDEPPAPKLEPCPELELGHYRLKAQLGRGASGSVWTAWDTQLCAWTALKIFHGKAVATRGLEVVMREARAASGIISDYVVLIKRAGRDEETGLHYIEMSLCAEYKAQDSGDELAVGVSLADEKPRSMREAARLVMEAAHGVEAAHRVGVIHRDMKPANILVTPVSRRAMVADFGLSAPELFGRLSAESRANETITMVLEEAPIQPPTGPAPPQRMIVGTPCYMAPEQAVGEDASRQSDVYGLGATLYALLAGRAPYIRKGEPRPGAMAVLARARLGPPTPLRVEAPMVPARLAAIVDRAMGRVRGERYATAAELAADLGAWLVDRPTGLDSRGPLLLMRLYARRNTVLVTTAFALGLLVLAFVVATGWLAGEASRLQEDVVELGLRKDLAERQVVEAEAKASEATAGEGEAMLEAKAAAGRALQAADSARQAREHATAAEEWARTETEAADRARMEALTAAATAEAAQTESEALRDAAQIERDEAVAEAGRRAVARDSAVRESERLAVQIAGVQAQLEGQERERESLEQRLLAQHMRSAEAEQQLADEEAQVERLQEQLKLLKAELLLLKAGDEPS